MSQQLHPFAKYIAILARGKTKTRPLSFEEACNSMSMIVNGEALPEQIGAFLMLMRLKEETGTEIAGFAVGARSTMKLPSIIPKTDIDWSSYAGKRRQLPYFIFSALLLAQNGIRLFMHGASGHTPGRIYTQKILEFLNFPIATSLTMAAEQIEQYNFAYVPLEIMSPQLHKLIEMRPIFGLRSPVHSFSRMLNPFNAPLMMQGIFHRGFADIHIEAARTLNQPCMVVFRGEGGEIERRPNKPCLVHTTIGKEKAISENWPVLLSDTRQEIDKELKIENMLALWRGEIENPYGKAAIIGTLAIAIKALKMAENKEAAERIAQDYWQNRDKKLLPFSI